MKRRSHTTESGYALVTVLWTVSFLTLSVAAFNRAQHTEASLSRLYDRVAIARARAESGIWLAIAQFFDQQATPRSDYRVTFDGAEIDIHIRPTNAKIDLNAADSTTLDALLAFSGVTDSERVSLAARILDWRDDDHERTRGGLEDRDFAAAGLGYGAKDAPFYSVDELRYIPGVTPALYRRLEPLLTVFGGDGSVDAEYAQRDVLLAMPSATPATVDALIASRASVSETAERWRGGSGIFEIASAATADKVLARIVAVVQIAPDLVPPYRVLEWTNDKPEGEPDVSAAAAR